MLCYVRKGLLVPVVTGMVFCILAVLAASCSGPALRVGVVLELEGSGDDLGQACRNGLLVAQSAREAAGGRPVELVIRSLGKTDDESRAVFKSLVDEGIHFFIGAYTSRKALALYDMISREPVVFVSPAASSIELRGRDDHFLRVITNNDLMADFLADQVIAAGQAEQVLVVYDTDNSAYSLPYMKRVVQGIQSGGGRVTPVPFSSSAKPDFTDVFKAPLGLNPKAVVCISNGMDGGFIAQHLRRTGSTAALWACAWSMSPDAIRAGAAAVEGMTFVSPSDMDSPLPAAREFASAYRTRFGVEPPFTAMLSGESFLLLASWLDTWGPDPQLILKKLADGYDFRGITGDMHLDAHGDMIRPLVCYSVQNGAFVRNPGRSADGAGTAGTVE